MQEGIEARGSKEEVEPGTENQLLQEEDRDLEEEEPKCWIGRTLICLCVTFCIGFFIFCLVLSVMGALFSGLANISKFVK